MVGNFIVNVCVCEQRRLCGVGVNAYSLYFLLTMHTYVHLYVSTQKATINGGSFGIFVGLYYRPGQFFGPMMRVYLLTLSLAIDRRLWLVRRC